VHTLLPEREYFSDESLHVSRNSIGAITAATATAPLDVLRTRFQSDYYKAYLNEARLARGIADPSTLSFNRSAALHIKETFQVLFAIPRVEGYRGLFKGLPAQLVGIVPARGISFFTYGTSKRFISETFNNGVEGPLVHLSSAAMAVALTASATNPIWVIKTRLQLDQRRSAISGADSRMYKSAMDCLAKTVRTEGVRGLYTGLSASLLGISESASQWMLYEEAKKRLRVRRAGIEDGSIQHAWVDIILEPFGDSVAAAGAKFLAAIATYPHEVSIHRAWSCTNNGRLSVPSFASLHRPTASASTRVSYRPFHSFLDKKAWQACTAG
jgi:solute carrier family 25, member 33/36